MGSTNGLPRTLTENRLHLFSYSIWKDPLLCVARSSVAGWPRPVPSFIFVVAVHSRVLLCKVMPNMPEEVLPKKIEAPRKEGGNGQRRGQHFSSKMQVGPSIALPTYHFGSGKRGGIRCRSQVLLDAHQLWMLARISMWHPPNAESENVKKPVIHHRVWQGKTGVGCRGLSHLSIPIGSGPPGHSP